MLLTGNFSPTMHDDDDSMSGVTNAIPSKPDLPIEMSE
jgi:hypothetical protein